MIYTDQKYICFVYTIYENENFCKPQCNRIILKLKLNNLQYVKVYYKKRKDMTLIRNQLKPQQIRTKFVFFFLLNMAKIQIA